MNSIGINSLLLIWLVVGFFTIVGLFIVGPWAVPVGMVAVGAGGYKCAANDNRRDRERKALEVQ